MSQQDKDKSQLDNECMTDEDIVIDVEPIKVEPIQQEETQSVNEQAENKDDMADCSSDMTSNTNNYKKVKRPNLFKRIVKRCFDFFTSFVAIALLSPFFIIFTPIVAIAMKGNPFFVQKRPGKDGKVFKMIKYRTMTIAKDKEGNLLPDEQRLTKFGKIMRKLSIDELPELFNILVGNMSVVGPRPLLVQYMPLYNEFQAQRHLVRPGLTGLAQVSGRNSISWQQKFEKDIEYIEKMSFFFDIKIIIMTVVKVFKKEGISQDGQATMEFFTGNDDKIVENCESNDNNNA